MKDIVTLKHGDGGEHTDALIKDIFYKYFCNDLLINSLDAAIFEVNKGKLALTTDSFVVKPLVFSGGNIGKLAVCGTVNDLTASGAKPLFLSCAFIIEEGFDMELLEEIVRSMGETCEKTGVKIITGDTKVVEKNSIDGIFINTSGIGIIHEEYNPKPICIGDDIIITGGIGEHGATIALERYKILGNSKLTSDCRPLNHIIEKLNHNMNIIKLMKDPTRGGLATALNEIVRSVGLNINIAEDKVPISREVKSINELLGIDSLYMACEGRMIIVVDKQHTQQVLNVLHGCEGCEKSIVIGHFEYANKNPIVIMETNIGGKRIIGSLEGEMLPRIC